MSQTAHKPVALSIAGFDPSGGAGVLADLKSFAAHDCYGVAAVAALTAQNTREVRRVAPVESGLLRQQIEMLFEDVAIAGVKIGLLGNRRNMEAVAESLAAHRALPIVVDPVLRSSSGTEFVAPQDLPLYRRLFFPQARVLTPNAEEAGRLLGIPVATLEEMKAAAKLLQEQGVPHVVVTGGHLDKPADVYWDGQELDVFSGQKVESQSTHGTGCTFSSALLANLIHGKTVKESIVLAKAFVSQAIARAFPIGSGQGPLNHLFRFGENTVRVGISEMVHETARG